MNICPLNFITKDYRWHEVWNVLWWLFRDVQVWGENADRLFPDGEAMIRWIDQPSLVPFLGCIPDPAKDSFRAFIVNSMLDRTKQEDGRCFETFRRMALARSGCRYQRRGIRTRRARSIPVACGPQQGGAPWERSGLEIVPCPCAVPFKKSGWLPGDLQSDAGSGKGQNRWMTVCRPDHFDFSVPRGL